MSKGKCLLVLLYSNFILKYAVKTSFPLFSFCCIQLALLSFAWAKELFKYIHHQLWTVLSNSPLFFCMTEELSMNDTIHLFNWFIPVPVLMKSRPDGICLHGFHYSDLNKPSHCYGTLQSPWSRQKLRAWCSRLSPPGSHSLSDQQQKMSGQNFNFQPATYTKLRQTHDENLEEVWQNPFFTFFPNHFQAEAAVIERPRQICQICQCCSGWCGHLHPARGTALLPHLHRGSSSLREHQQLPRAPGQYCTNVEFVNMFFKANFGNIWADILLLHRY